MKRKFVSVLLALILCLSMMVCASAASDIDFVVDEIGNLADSEIALLNKVAGDLYRERGVGIFFVYTKAESLSDYDISRVVGSMENYFVMMENDTSWYTFTGGLGENIDAATEEELRDVYDVADTYVGGVEDFLKAAAECFPNTADAPEEDTPAADSNVLFDDADLLSTGEEVSLTAKLLHASEKYDAQIVVATIASMDGGNIDQFVEFLYDTMEFGYGEDRDGVLLLVCMDPREYRILSNGYAGVAIGSDEIDSISDIIVSDLSDGDYAEAFGAYVDQCEYYLDGHLNGFPFDFGMNLLIALVIGIVVGLIVAFVLKGQLKSVRKQDQANVYVKPGSMQITLHNDLFLYRNVTRTKKESNKSSSSGSSRSVGGGSF